VAIGHDRASAVDSALPAHASLHAVAIGRTLRPRPRRVRTPVFTMRNAQVDVLGLGLDALNSLDGVRDVGEVDEGAVPMKYRRKYLTP
jgi:hypothetical protein